MGILTGWAVRLEHYNISEPFSLSDPVRRRFLHCDMKEKKEGCAGRNSISSKATLAARHKASGIDQRAERQKGSASSRKA